MPVQVLEDGDCGRRYQRLGVRAVAEVAAAAQRLADARGWPIRTTRG